MPSISQAEAGAATRQFLVIVRSSVRPGPNMTSAGSTKTTNRATRLRPSGQRLAVWPRTVTRRWGQWPLHANGPFGRAVAARARDRPVQRASGTARSHRVRSTPAPGSHRLAPPTRASHCDAPGSVGGRVNRTTVRLCGRSTSLAQRHSPVIPPCGPRHGEGRPRAAR